TIDARVVAHSNPPPSIRRTTPITITNRLRFRPAVLRETMPTTAPTIASGTISQLAQPSRGMKATIARISATMPMISEARLNITGLLTSFGGLRQARCTQQGDNVEDERGPDRREGDGVGPRERFAVEQDRDQELQGRREELQHSKR